MICVVQRVKEASVHVAHECVGAIKHGLLVFVGVAGDDNRSDVTYMADKVAGLRIFDDMSGKMGRSVMDVHGEILVVSEFTLCGDCTKGRRPNFSRAADSSHGREMYELFVEKIRSHEIRTETGTFGASMEVKSVNDGPVTLVVVR